MNRRQWVSYRHSTHEGEHENHNTHFPTCRAGHQWRTGTIKGIREKVVVKEVRGCVITTTDGRKLKADGRKG